MPEVYGRPADKNQCRRPIPTGRRPPAPVIHVSGRLRAEENEDYRPVIAALSDRWRVVVCKNGIQWVLQTRRGPRWHGRYFCRSREGLIQCVREHAGAIDGVALVRLLRLPMWIGGAP